MTREEPLLIVAGGQRLHAMLYAPDGPAHGVVIICPPLFEELKSSTSTLVELARRLAARGHAAIRIDLRGCGDSAGRLDEFEPQDWLADVRSAIDWSRTHLAGLPVGLVGLRLGATLAAAAAAADRDVAFLVLWQPVTDGQAYLVAELRHKLMKEALTFGRSSATRSTLLGDLASGRSVDFDGHPVSAVLHRGLAKLVLSDAPLARALPALVCHLGATESLPADVERAAAALRAKGVNVETLSLRIPPFWNLIGSCDTSALVSRTAEWIERLSAPVARQAKGPPADRPPAEAAESPVAWTSGDRTLRGILHPPAGPDQRTAVVFLHGWSGTRIGPHRMFVTTARRLAAEGFTCLRFDFAGRGESDGLPGGATIESMADDAAAAVAWLQARGLARVWLLGICSGGKVAIATAARMHEAVAGLALWSAEPLGSLHSRATQRRQFWHALRTYGRKALRMDTWRKALRGQVRVDMVQRAVLNPERPGEAEIRREDRVLAQFRNWRRPLLFIYGGNDPATAAAADGYRAFCRANAIPHEFHRVEGANHSFYSIPWEQEVIQRTEQALRRLAQA